ncbi:hypothetical protein BJ742DRAFT_737306 [Cladochytrium replicatum]|nr:hypothetical protein BJ742DRAFT_737306 [Cladochytrium replicatum]
MLEMGFMHCDLKSENIVVDPTRTRVKLIDFGPRFLDTPDLVAPEVQCYPENKEDYGFTLEEQEFWSLGLILLKLVFCTNPFRNEYHDARVVERWGVGGIKKDQEKQDVKVSDFTKAMLVGGWGKATTGGLTPGIVEG